MATDILFPAIMFLVLCPSALGLICHFTVFKRKVRVTLVYFVASAATSGVLLTAFLVLVFHARLI